MSIESANRKALIIGCGIAGPVAAMALQRAGLTPVVYEGRPEPRDEAGFFVNLSLNGLAVLDTLGVKEEVVRCGTPTTSMAFLNHRGKQLGANPQTTVLLKRGPLTKALREALKARGIAVELGRRLEDIAITPQGGVSARFENGSEAHGDVLIGCDGIHSRTRRSIMPEAPQARYLGIIDSGGFTPGATVPPADGVMRMVFGLKGFFGYQATPTGEIYWFENFAEPCEPGREALEAIPDEQWRRKLLELHRGDDDVISEIIRATEGGIGKWPNYEMPPLPSWHKGPVCLIGDAAHAMSPAAGQGASMAMEDAIVLAKCLRDVPKTEDAFAAFERLRKDRVESIARAARRNSGQKGPTNAVTRRMRDLMLPFFLKMGVKGAERVSSYRVDWDEKVA